MTYTEAFWNKEHYNEGEPPFLTFQLGEYDFNFAALDNYTPTASTTKVDIEDPSIDSFVQNWRWWSVYDTEAWEMIQLGSTARNYEKTDIDKLSTQLLSFLETDLWKEILLSLWIDDLRSLTVPQGIKLSLAIPIEKLFYVDTDLSVDRKHRRMPDRKSVNKLMTKEEFQATCRNFTSSTKAFFEALKRIQDPASNQLINTYCWEMYLNKTTDETYWLWLFDAESETIKRRWIERNYESYEENHSINVFFTVNPDKSVDVINADPAYYNSINSVILDIFDAWILIDDARVTSNTFSINEDYHRNLFIYNIIHYYANGLIEKEEMIDYLEQLHTKRESNGAPDWLQDTTKRNMYQLLADRYIDTSTWNNRQKALMYYVTGEITQYALEKKWVQENEIQATKQELYWLILDIETENEEVETWVIEDIEWIDTPFGKLQASLYQKLQKLWIDIDFVKHIFDEEDLLQFKKFYEEIYATWITRIPLEIFTNDLVALWKKQKDEWFDALFNREHAIQRYKTWSITKRNKQDVRQEVLHAAYLNEISVGSIQLQQAVISGERIYKSFGDFKRSLLLECNEQNNTTVYDFLTDKEWHEISKKLFKTRWGSKISVKTTIELVDKYLYSSSRNRKKYMYLFDSDFYLKKERKFIKQNAKFFDKKTMKANILKFNLQDIAEYMEQDYLFRPGFFYQLLSVSPDLSRETIEYLINTWACSEFTVRNRYKVKEDRESPHMIPLICMSTTPYYRDRDSYLAYYWDEITPDRFNNSRFFISWVDFYNTTSDELGIDVNVLLQVFHTFWWHQYRTREEVQNEEHTPLERNHVYGDYKKKEATFTISEFWKKHLLAIQELISSDEEYANSWNKTQKLNTLLENYKTENPEVIWNNNPLKEE